MSERKTNDSASTYLYVYRPDDSGPGCAFTTDAPVSKLVFDYDRKIYVDTGSHPSVRIGVDVFAHDTDVLRYYSVSALSTDRALVPKQSEIIDTIRRYESTTGIHSETAVHIAVVPCPENSGLRTSIARLACAPDARQTVSSVLRSRLHRLYSAHMVVSPGDVHNPATIPYRWSWNDAWPVIVPTTLVVVPRHHIPKWVSAMSVHSDARVLFATCPDTIRCMCVRTHALSGEDPVIDEIPDMESAHLTDTHTSDTSGSDDDQSGRTANSGTPTPLATPYSQSYPPPMQPRAVHPHHIRYRRPLRESVLRDTIDRHADSDDSTTPPASHFTPTNSFRHLHINGQPLPVHRPMSINIYDNTGEVERIPVQIRAGSNEHIGLDDAKIDVIVVALDIYDELFKNPYTRNVAWARVVLDQVHEWAVDMYDFESEVKSRLPISQSYVVTSPVLDYIRYGMFPEAIFQSITKIVLPTERIFRPVHYADVGIRHYNTYYIMRYEVDQYRYRSCALRMREEAEYTRAVRRAYARVGSDHATWWDASQTVSTIMEQEYRNSISQAQVDEDTEEPIHPTIVVPAAVYGERDDVVKALGARFDHQQVPFRSRNEVFDTVRDRVMRRFDSLARNNSDEMCSICRSHVIHRRPTVYAACCTTIFCMMCIRDALLRGNVYMRNGFMRCMMCTTPMIPGSDRDIVQQMVSAYASTHPLPAIIPRPLPDVPDNSLIDQDIPPLEPTELEEAGIPPPPPLPAHLATRAAFRDAIATAVTEAVHDTTARNQFFDNHMFIYCEPFVERDRTLINIVRARTDPSARTSATSNDPRYGKWTELSDADMSALMDCSVENVLAAPTRSINMFDPSQHPILHRMVSESEKAVVVIDRVIGPKVAILALPPALGYIASLITEIGRHAIAIVPEIGTVTVERMRAFYADSDAVLVMSTDTRSGYGIDLSAVTDLIVYGDAIDARLTWPILYGQLIGFHRHRRLNMHYV